MRVQNPGLAAGQVASLLAITTFSAADILALSTSPKILVPAPGAGKVINVQEFALVFTAGTFPFYNGNGDQVDVFYQGSAVDLVDPSALSGNLAVAATNYFATSAPGSSSSFSSVASPYVNTAVVLSGVNYNGGPIQTMAVNAGGSGYAVNDTGHVTGGNGVAEYKVTAVGAGGAVTSVSVVLGGAGYVNATGAATTVLTGAGNGALTLNTTTNQGNGTMKTYTYYTILPVP